MSAPFPNEYRSRQVAESDCKPCSICYKPSSTVLLASNKADHFYTCPLHLKDKSFASATHPEAYTQLLKDRTRLENEVRQANAVAEANKPYSWNKLMTNIGWSESPKSEDAKAKDASTEETKEAKKKKENYEDYVKQANDLKKQLADVNSSITGFQFKDYVLVKDVYRMRVNNTLKAKTRVQPQKPIHEQAGIVFPAAPKSDIH